MLTACLMQLARWDDPIKILLLESDQADTFKMEIAVAHGEISKEAV